MINVGGMDRMIAFLIIDGKVYESGCNHQDCLLYYYDDIGHKDRRLLDDEDAYFESLDELTDRTYHMKCAHEVYGFDVFRCSDKSLILVAHDRETLDANEKWAREWSVKNKASLGYFISYSGKEVALAVD